MEKPKISIVLPVYNMEDYLNDTIQCLVNQTLREIEIIFVDDASTDSTMEILQDWAKRDSRIVVHGLEHNQSEWSARKYGIEHATGQYMMFLDPDDTLDVCACAELYAEMEKNPVDILHFGTNLINVNDLPEKRIQDLENFLQPYDGVLYDKEIFTSCFDQGLYRFTVWNKIYDTELCKCSIATSKNWYLSMSADKLLYWMVSLNAKSYRGVPGKVYYNYYFGRGITGQPRVTLRQFQRHCDMAIVADKMHDYLVEKKLDQQYSKIDQQNQIQMLNSCMYELERELTDKEKGAAFDCMVKKWGVMDTVSAFANRYWLNHYQAVKILQGSTSLEFDGRKIKCIALYYHRCFNGGVERVICELAMLWRSMGYEIVIITDEPPTMQDYFLPEGIKRVVIPDGRNMSKEEYRPRAEALEKALKEYHVDAVVYHAWVAQVLLWDELVCKANGVAFVCHTHGVFSYLMTKPWVDFGSVATPYLLADAVVTLSKVDKYFWKHFNDNVFETINPFTDSITDWHCTTKLDQRQILWVGRLSVEKKPLDSLRIMKEVVKRIPDAHLHVVGSGSTPEYAEKMTEYIQANELSANVTMHGYQTDVRHFYEEASLFLITSEYEGYSLTLQESKMAGLPVVMYDLPYLTLCEGQRGMVCVENNNISATADAIIDILLDNEKRQRMSREARAHAEELFAFDFEAKWTEIFESIGKAHSSAIPEESKIMLNTLLYHNSIGIGELRENEWKKSRQLTKVQRDYKTMQSSAAMRIGRVITYIPRKTRGFFRNCKNYGIRHAIKVVLKRAWEKLNH